MSNLKLVYIAKKVPPENPKEDTFHPEVFFRDPMLITPLSKDVETSDANQALRFDSPLKFQAWAKLKEGYSMQGVYMHDLPKEENKSLENGAAPMQANSNRGKSDE